MTATTPRVIDISHHNIGPLKGGQIDFEAVGIAQGEIERWPTMAKIAS
jgi:hypothetical protein